MKLLVPVDLEHPLDLLDLAATVARRLAADLQLLTVIDPDRGRDTFPHATIESPPPAGDISGGLIRPRFASVLGGPSGTPVETRDQALERLRAAARQRLQLLADRLADVPVTVDVAVQPHPAVAIADYVAQHSIDVLLMRSHGRRGLSRAVFGSVAEEVVRRVETPVLLVGPSFAGAAPLYDELIVCVDGSAVSEEILPLARWARTADLHVTAVTAVPTGQGGAEAQAKAAYVERLGLALRGEGVRADWAVIPGPDPAAAITSYAAARPTSIVALITHGRTGLPRLVAGSVAMRVVRDVATPVLVMHAHRSAA